MKYKLCEYKEWSQESAGTPGGPWVSLTEARGSISRCPLTAVVVGTAAYGFQSRQREGCCPFPQGWVVESGPPGADSYGGFDSSLVIIAGGQFG